MSKRPGWQLPHHYPTTLQAVGIIGCVRFLERYYLLLVTKSRSVGTVCGERPAATHCLVGLWRRHSLGWACSSNLHSATRCSTHLDRHTALALSSCSLLPGLLRLDTVGTCKEPLTIITC